MAGAAQRLGWHPFPGPAAINSRALRSRSACLYHGFCSRGGCHVDGEELDRGVDDPARASAPASSTIVTEAHVTRIDVDADGRAAGVQYLKDGETYIQPAAAVLLACYTYENVRLLLLSTSPAYPRGLANNRGQVGRHYFTHNQGGGVLALFPHKLNRWYGLAGAGRRGRRLGRRQLRSSATRLHRRRQSLGLFRPAADRGREHADVRPRAALGLAVESVRHGERRPLGQLVPAEDDAAVRGQLPRSASDREGSARRSRHAASRPITRTTRSASRAFVQDKMEQWFLEAGAIATVRAARRHDGRLDARLRRHAHGRRSRDERRRPLRASAHEVPNLGVLGASVMGTSGARNPTLTAQALAWRTAEHLVCQTGARSRSSCGNPSQRRFGGLEPP